MVESKANSFGPSRLLIGTANHIYKIKLILITYLKSYKLVGLPILSFVHNSVGAFAAVPILLDFLVPVHLKTNSSKFNLALKSSL